jgi:succinyl-diaminopimelate desuccinylase
MSRLIDYLSTRTLPIEIDSDFSFGPKLSVTEIGGGGGFSQIPGKCEAKIDIRLTPHFAEDSARRLIDEGIRWVDAEFPTGKSSFFETNSSWPWYKLNRESAPVQILGKCAEEAFKKSIAFDVCGPSNIGNYLAAHRIPATCGLGVSYENLHAPNECVNVGTIIPTYETYLSALRRWSDIDFTRLKSQLLESAPESTLSQK